MTTIHRVNLLLLMLFLILLGFNFWPVQSDYYPLTSLHKKSIHSILLKKKNKTLLFTKENQQWFIASDKKRKLDQNKINKLLGLLRTHQYREFTDTPQNRTTFHLNQPFFQVIFNDLNILFGTTDPATHLRYILLNNKILLINDLYLQYLKTDEDFWIK